MQQHSCCIVKCVTLGRFYEESCSLKIAEYDWPSARCASCFLSTNIQNGITFGITMAPYSLSACQV
eukprot:scaffold8836_cov73-Skeletonema_dohrnii-CCMP3373.AAC.1